MTVPELKASAIVVIFVAVAMDADFVWRFVRAWRSGETYGLIVKGPIRRSENPSLYWRNVLMGIPAITIITAAAGWLAWAVLHLP